MVAWLVALAVGLGALLAGGHALGRGAASLAETWGVSSLVIGLTVVAFGTSAPELAFNLTAVLRGSGDVAFGNLMGSNLANVGLVLGVAAVDRPLPIQGILITREIPMMLAASFAVLVMGFDPLRGEPESSIDRSEGLLLLLLFSIFRTTRWVPRSGGTPPIRWSSRRRACTSGARDRRSDTRS